MKEKILQALKNKYANLGFSAKAFEGMAEYLAITVTEEDQIDNATSGAEIVLKGFQGDADKRVNDAVAKAKAENQKPNPTPEPNPANPKPEDPKDDTPSWAKSLIESHKALQTELTAIKAGKTTETRKSIFEKKLEKVSNPKLKATMLKDFERIPFDSDDDFQSYLTEKESDISKIIQEQSNQGLSRFGQPYKAQTDPKGQASKEEVKDIVDSIM